MNDVVFNKIAAIERAVRRAKEEYFKDVLSFDKDYTRQDAAILNIQRACESSLDLVQYLIRRDGLGLPQSSRDVFVLLERESKITRELSTKLQHMVGFRNIAVHDYQALSMGIVKQVLETHVDNFLEFTKTILSQEIPS